MDIYKILTLIGILIPACVVGYLINKKTTNVKQPTWFVRSPYWWQWYQPYPYTWQGYIIVCLFIISAVFIVLSHSRATPLLFFLILLVYIFISYKTSRKKGGKTPNVSAPSTYNPNISFLRQKSFFFFILDKLLLLFVATIIFTLVFGFLYLSGYRHP